ncbi:HEAT repeat domain-containing protein [Geobacter sp. AOG1]|uniref:HEAT repeat domain-containing protein n=1 Tax=Geobacter sp. AOG1 TaxID=1566346 RepID=UPI001CC506CA|nr:HEAT repeat domain-containing protein [Geobacter sp. AOG1]
MEKSELGLDTRLLSDFICELNISRRHVTAYPSNHPIIVASAGKVLRLLQRLLEVQPVLTIGIARDTLIIGEGFLDRNNPLYRDLARALFGHGIASISFSGDLPPEELQRFNEILCLKKEEVRGRGGIEAVVAAAGITHLQVQAIDYSSFHATDEVVLTQPERETVELWEQFIHGLLEGTLAPWGERAAEWDAITPEMMAQALNRQLALTPAKSMASYEQAVTDFLRNMDRQRARGGGSETIDKLAACINQLNPEVRRQFLLSAFSSLPARQEMAEELVKRFPPEVILDALEDISVSNSSLSPVVLDLVKKLAAHAPLGEAKSQVAKLQQPTERELRDDLAMIFREDNGDHFLPAAYQEKLRTIVAIEGVSALEEDEIAELKETLTNHCVETEVNAVILEILKELPDDCPTHVLQRNLLDLSGYFLEMGDFASLATMYDRLESIHPAMEMRTAGLFGEVLAVFARPEFVAEVVQGLVFWGKAKYGEIQRLILRVGAPFAGPLLDALAQEQRMSLRHFYMDCLQKMGAIARDAALARLRDSRWYFVRNLLVLLRDLDDPTVVRHIKLLLSHPHPKVRQELLKTLLHYQDPESDRLLHRYLTGKDREQRLMGVQLAAQSRNPQVVTMLLAFLAKGGIADYEFGLKSAVVKTLGEMGNVDALPELVTLLRSRNLLHPQKHALLKVKIVHSLAHYPPAWVSYLLDELCRGDNQELAKAASDVRQQLSVRGA